MKHKSWWVFLVTVVLALVIYAFPVEGFVDELLGRQNLRGIQGVAVVIGELPPDFKKYGLTESQLQVDIELKLRMAGIKVLTGKKAIDQPFVYVQVEGGKKPNSYDLYLYHIGVELHQGVYLMRNKSIFSVVPTWSTGSFGEVSSQQFTFIRDRVKDFVDQFINDYLSVNQKQ